MPRLTASTLLHTGAACTLLPRMQYVITSLRDDRMNHDVLLSNLEYIGEVLGVLAAKAE